MGQGVRLENFPLWQRLVELLQIVPVGLNGTRNTPFYF